MSQARVLVDIPSRGTTALLVTATGAWRWAHPRETPRCLLRCCPWRGALVVSEQLGRKTARGSAANVTPAQRDDLSPWVSPELNFADYYQGRGLPMLLWGLMKHIWDFFVLPWCSPGVEASLSHGVVHGFQSLTDVGSNPGSAAY